MSMREDLKAFVDDELSPQRRAEVMREIDADPALQAEVIELRQISRVLQEEVVEPQPVGLERTLGALLANGSSSRSTWRGLALQWGAALGACAVIAAILFPIFSQAKEAAKQDRAEGAVSASMPATFSESTKGRSQGLERAQTKERELQELGGFQLDDRRQPQSKSSQSNADMAQEVAPQAGTVNLAPQIIRTAYMHREVESVEAAVRDVETWTKAAGGRTERVNTSGDKESLPTAELVLRIPVARFDNVVDQIRKLGTKISENISSEDVTAQVADVEARLKVMRAEEDQYVELLKSANKVGEILSIKERLSQVRQEIESLEANRKVLRSQAAMSTINLTLTQKPSIENPKEPEGWLESAWVAAVNGLKAVGRFLASAGVFLFVFAPIWIPLVLIIWWLNRRNRK